MKTAKRLVALFLACAMAFAAGACASGGTASSGTSSVRQNASNPSVSQKGNYPVTIKTHNYAKQEVEITFDKAPEKVICYELNSLENMIALGLQDKIILAMGVQPDEVLEEYQGALKDIPRVQQEFITKEEAISLQPDFILAWYSSFSDKRLGDVGFWHERDTNTYMAYNSGLGDQNLQNEYNDILNLGKIFGVEDRAEALVKEMKDKVSKAQEYVKDKEPVNVAILEDEGDVFRVYGENSIGGDIAVQVGANLVAKDKNERKSAEDLVQLNPEMIFSVHFGPHSTSLNPENCLDVFRKPVFQTVKAVKDEKLYPVDLSFVYSPGVRVTKSIDFFIEKLYPDLKMD